MVNISSCKSWDNLIKRYIYEKKRFYIEDVDDLKNKIERARIYERGSSETMACGSAACAISASLKALKGTILAINYVHMHGGKAQVKWSGNQCDSIYLIGKAEYVFTGNYIL